MISISIITDFLADGRDCWNLYVNLFSMQGTILVWRFRLRKKPPFREAGRMPRWHPFSYLIAKDHRSLGKSVDLAGQTGLLARRAVLVVYVVRSRLIDRLACERKEGFRFISVSSLNGVEDAAGSRAHTGLLSGVLRMALCVGFHTKDRSFDVRQVIHPLVFRTILEYDSTRRGKKQPLFP